MPKKIDRETLRMHKIVANYRRKIKEKVNAMSEKEAKQELISHMTEFK